jgi:hypothetical protein
MHPFLPSQATDVSKMKDVAILSPHSCDSAFRLDAMADMEDSLRSKASSKKDAAHKRRWCDQEIYLLQGPFQQASTIGEQASQKRCRYEKWRRVDP